MPHPDSRKDLDCGCLFCRLLFLLQIMIKGIYIRGTNAGILWYWSSEEELLADYGDWPHPNRALQSYCLVQLISIGLLWGSNTSTPTTDSAPLTWVLPRKWRRGENGLSKCRWITLEPSIFMAIVHPPSPHPKSPIWQYTGSSCEPKLILYTWLINDLFQGRQTMGNNF